MITEIDIALKAIQIFSEQHPRPSHVSQKQAAEMLGVSHVTVAKLVRSGEIRTNAVGKIPTCEVDRVLAARG